MRIAYLALLASPDQPATGGVQKVSETLLQQFEKTEESLSVHALTLTPGLQREERVQRGNVTYHFLPCARRGKLLQMYRREIRLLRRRVWELKVDVVHGQPWAEYMLASVGCGLPSVLTVHGLPQKEASQESLLRHTRMAGLVRELLQGRALRQAQNIISISPYVDDYLRARTHARLWRVPNPIEDEFFDIEPVQRGGLRLLCVGTLSARKNQQLLIAVCARLAAVNVKFGCRIIGADHTGVGERLRRQVKTKKLEDSIEITGPIPKYELLQQYTWSNVVVLPSFEETSPLSLIQAMACGRCVFGAAAAGIPTLLQNGKLGTLFSPVDPDDLAEKLIDFQATPEMYRRKAAAAEAYARATFRARAIADKTLATYRDILASNCFSSSSEPDTEVVLPRSSIRQSRTKGRSSALVRD
jgi:glycosyltransferase involved in cell wall biosynthesis